VRPGGRVRRGVAPTRPAERAGESSGRTTPHGGALRLVSPSDTDALTTVDSQTSGTCGNDGSTTRSTTDRGGPSSGSSNVRATAICSSAADSGMMPAAFAAASRSAGASSMQRNRRSSIAFALTVP
jgi:hypothetical protein